MSTYSDAWHAASPLTHSYYRNFHHRYLRFSRRLDSIFNPPPGDWFLAPGWGYHAYSGFAVAQRNWGVQILETGSFNTDTILWAAFEWHSIVPPSPRSSFAGSGDWHDQFIDIIHFAVNYPRPKLNVPRTYWTGKPARRRNL